MVCMHLRKFMPWEFGRLLGSEGDFSTGWINPFMGNGSVATAGVAFRKACSVCLPALSPRDALLHLRRQQEDPQQGPTRCSRHTLGLSSLWNFELNKPLPFIITQSGVQL